MRSIWRRTRGARVIGEAPARAFATAEEKPPVGREPKIVHHEARIDDGDVVENQRPRARFAQGFGGQDEVVDRHHAAPHAGVQRIQIAIASEHDRIRRDRVRAGLDRAGRAGSEAADGRPLADIHACLYRRLGEAARVVERMKVARAPIQKAAVKPLRRHLRAESRAIEHVDLVVAVAGAEMLGLPRQRTHVARAVRSDGNSGFQAALDPVPGDARADEGLRLLGERPEEPRPVLHQAPAPE